MSKSFSAKVMSDLLELFGMYTEKNYEQMLAGALSKGEKPTPSPSHLKTRYEDSPYGRVFYANEESDPRTVVFYIHGGAYFMDFTMTHWKFLETLVKEADAQVIAPAYRLVPFATWREAFDLIVPLYREYCEAHPDKKIILMGDSAGGGLSLALTEHFKAEEIRMPDELILLSPWVDVSMDNEQIREYESVDPFLAVTPLRNCGEQWKGELDVHDWHVSPVYGDLKGIHNVTVFVGTDGILYPDITKFFGLLDKDPSNELIVGEEMNHVYPLFPIPEAKPAVNRIIQIINRDAVMTHENKARAYFGNKFHCSQAVLAAFAKELGLTEETALKIAYCFNSGMRKGEVCGSCSGALMVLGMLYGQSEKDDPESRGKADRMTEEFLDRFKEKNGSYICSEILGCDISTPEGKEQAEKNDRFTTTCPEMVASAVRILEEITDSRQ